jgi:hypothetical protein
MQRFRLLRAFGKPIVDPNTEQMHRVTEAKVALFETGDGHAGHQTKQKAGNRVNRCSTRSVRATDALHQCEGAGARFRGQDATPVYLVGRYGDCRAAKYRRDVHGQDRLEDKAIAVVQPAWIKQYTKNFSADRRAPDKPAYAYKLIATRTTH